MSFDRHLTDFIKSLLIIENHCINSDSLQSFRSYRNDFSLQTPTPKTALLQVHWDIFLTELYADKCMNYKLNNICSKNVLGMLVSVSHIVDIMAYGLGDFMIADKCKGNMSILIEVYKSMRTCMLFWTMYTCLEEIVKPPVDKLRMFDCDVGDGFGSFKEKTLEALTFLNLADGAKLSTLDQNENRNDVKADINQTIDYMTTHIKLIVSNLRYLDESTIFDNKGFQTFYLNNQYRFTLLLNTIANNKVLIGLESQLDKDLVSMLWYLLLNETIANRALNYHSNNFMVFLYSLFRKSLEIDYLSIDVKTYQITKTLFYEVIRLVRDILTDNTSVRGLFDTALFIVLKEELLVFYKDVKLIKQSKTAFCKVKYLGMLFVHCELVGKIDESKAQLLTNLNARHRFSGS